MTQFSPYEQWVEQDPIEIIEVIKKCAEQAVQKLGKFSPNKFTINDIATLGVTNQRETIVVWDKTTGLPLHNAIGE